MRKTLISILLIGYLGYSLFYAQVLKEAILITCDLWLRIIVPSFVPMFFIGSLLCDFPFLSKMLFKFTSKMTLFANTTSCSIFLLSLIIGNPATTLLINKALEMGKISTNEGNRLMRFTTHMSPLFVIAICHNTGYAAYAWYFWLSSVLMSIFLLITKRANDTGLPNIIHLPTNNIIEKAPLVLSRILMIMLLVTIFKLPLQSLALLNRFPFCFLLDLFEVTIGCQNILRYATSPYIVFPCFTFLISLSGFCIIGQVFVCIKKTKLMFKNYLYYRFIHAIGSAIISLVFCLIIF